MRRVLHLYMLGWIIQKSRAETHLEIIGFENGKVPAALTTFPEFGIVCKI
jgi:hypothetical protein